MTSIKQPGGDLPDNLPLLTQVTDEDAPDDLPTLTEVVAEGQAEPAAELQPGADGKVPAPENEPSHARFPLPNPLNETISHSTKLPKTAAESLVIPQAGEGTNESLREFHINEEEMQRLLRQVETHLETVFIQKLNLNLEQLQHQAVEQVVSELKAELPELLRNALNVRHGL